jgi:hypothetical protein
MGGERRFSNDWEPVVLANRVLAEGTWLTQELSNKAFLCCNDMGLHFRGHRSYRDSRFSQH